MFSSEVSLLNNPLIQDNFFIVLDGSFAPRKYKRTPVKALVFFRVCHKYWQKKVFYCYNYLYSFKWRAVAYFKMFLFWVFYLQLEREAGVPVLVFTEEFSHTATRKCGKFCLRKFDSFISPELLLQERSLQSGLESVCNGEIYVLTKAATWLSPRNPTLLPVSTRCWELLSFHLALKHQKCFVYISGDSYFGNVKNSVSVNHRKYSPLVCFWDSIIA